MKDPGWAESYQNKFNDMVDRGVVRKLTPIEFEDWKQPFFLYKSFSCFKPEVKKYSCKDCVQLRTGL